MGNILDLSVTWRYAVEKTSSARNASFGESKPTGAGSGMASALGSVGARSKSNYSEVSTGTGTKAGSDTSKQGRDGGAITGGGGKGNDSGGVDSGGGNKPGNPMGGAGNLPGGGGGGYVPPHRSGSGGEIPI